jgi:aryl-alcohol dehydrogenase-like predicted oxidoreductase
LAEYLKGIIPLQREAIVKHNRMEKRKLGNTGLEVSPLAFGGNVFGWTVDKARSFELLDAFVAAGFNFIDTANSYSRWVAGNSGGESETIIGSWLKKSGNRDKVIIATKVGSDMGDGNKGLSKKYILQAVDESLKRLQSDYIDLYQSHFPDPATPFAETLEAYALLLKQGKIRAIGGSNLTPEMLREEIQVARDNNLPSYQTLQPLYNLYDRAAFEKELQPICLENNIAVINYYALASGFLTGKYRSEDHLSKSARGGGVKKYLTERGFRILNALDKVAKETSSTPAQVSIAWLLTRPTIAAPIASATSLEQLKDLQKAVTLQLSTEALKILDEASGE